MLFLYFYFGWENHARDKVQVVCGNDGKVNTLVVEAWRCVVCAVNVPEITLFDAVFVQQCDKRLTRRSIPDGRKMQKAQNRFTACRLQGLCGIQTELQPLRLPVDQLVKVGASGIPDSVSS